jgi:rare lipoprotein A
VGGQTAQASFYGDESGSRTASGEPFNPGAYTFANRTMRFGTVVEFCHGGRCVRARCNDRGPFVAGRTFDLSRATFAAIAPLGAGVISVSWRVV